jgi:hypothetical protein
MSVFTNRIEGDNVDVVHVDGTIAVSNPGLTDAELRATPVPVSGTVAVSSVAGTVLVDGSAVTQPISGSVTVLNASIPVTGTFWQAIQPVSGTVAVSNPGLTDAELRATPVPVSGTVTTLQGTSPWVVSGTVAVSNFPADADALAQGSTTSGQLGALVMGAVTTAAPTYTTATTNPLSIDTAGNLRVTVSNATASNKASAATITRIATSTTAVTVLASNANRKKLVIRTETGTHNYVAFGSTATATNYTYDLGSDATLEDIVWTGSVSIIRASGTGTVQVTELV